MKTTTIKKAVLGGLAGAAAVGIALSGSSTAFANPDTTPRAINITGSDTVQDVMNGVANDALLGTTKYIGSWDAKSATWTGTGIAPNGSTEGLQALSAALKGEKWKNPSNVEIDVVGKVQAARSSSEPGSRQNNDGPLQFIPLGRDAVTYATAATTVVPSGIPLIHATGSNELSLKRIFSCEVGSFEFDGEWYHTMGSPTGSTKLEPIRLQSGSGTRSFWEGTSATGTPGSCVEGFANSTVQEHRGEVLVNRPNALVPFSIAQWIAQSNAGAANQNGTVGTALGIPVEDRRYGAQLNSVGAAKPIVDGKQNGSFLSALTRDVYNVIPAAAVNDFSTPENVMLNAAFVGPQAAASNTVIIEKFGFSTSLKSGFAVGSINKTLRANYYQ